MIDIPFLPLYTGGGENIGFSTLFFQRKTEILKFY